MPQDTKIKNIVNKILKIDNEKPDGLAKITNTYKDLDKKINEYNDDEFKGLINQICLQNQPLGLTQYSERLNEMIFERVQFEQLLKLLTVQPDFLPAAVVTQKKIATNILSKYDNDRLFDILKITKQGQPNTFTRLLNINFDCVPQIEETDYNKIIKSKFKNAVLQCTSDQLTELLTDRLPNHPNPLIKSIIFKPELTVSMISRLNLDQTKQVLEPFGQDDPLQQAESSLKNQGAKEPILIWAIENKHPLARLFIFDPKNEPLLAHKTVASWLKNQIHLKEKLQPLIKNQINIIEKNYTSSRVTRIADGIFSNTTSQLDHLYPLVITDQPMIASETFSNKASKKIDNTEHLAPSEASVKENNDPNAPKPG
ncbi:hypothetical protein N9Y17_04350 [Gammaproteobacteria bacterium]|nr:hypothetical protein [Gammaproteobacteria bacterium]